MHVLLSSLGLLFLVYFTSKVVSWVVPEWAVGCLSIFFFTYNTLYETLTENKEIKKIKLKEINPAPECVYMFYICVPVDINIYFMCL